MIITSDLFRSTLNSLSIKVSIEKVHLQLLYPYPKAEDGLRALKKTSPNPTAAFAPKAPAPNPSVNALKLPPDGPTIKLPPAYKKPPDRASTLRSPRIVGAVTVVGTSKGSTKGIPS
jgi:hypothetical protein